MEKKRRSTACSSRTQFSIIANQRMKAPVQKMKIGEHTVYLKNCFECDIAFHRKEDSLQNVNRLLKRSFASIKQKVVKSHKSITQKMKWRILLTSRRVLQLLFRRISKEQKKQWKKIHSPSISLTTSKTISQ